MPQDWRHVKRVNLKRLGKQFRRELKAHPKKAALLALLVAVGLYNWTPVVRGWFSSKTTSMPAQSVPSLPGSSLSAPAAAPVLPWPDLIEAMKRDPLKAPAQNVLSWRDPFRPSPQQLAIIEQERQLRERLANGAGGNGAVSGKGVAAPPRELTPANAGLSVTSTLVSSTQRMAMIKGNIVEGDRIVKQAIVAEGGVVRVRAGGEEIGGTAAAARKSAKPTDKSPGLPAALAELSGTTASFRVVRIDPRAVTLEYRGREYELSLARPKPAGNLSIRKATEKE
jgi:hypothetical protein